MNSLSVKLHIPGILFSNETVSNINTVTMITEQITVTANERFINSSHNSKQLLEKA